jgi:hypothetical protein
MIALRHDRADDAAPRWRVDRMGTAGAPTQTPEGYWEVDATIAIPGVMEYVEGGQRVREYVAPEVLADEAWLKSLENQPVTIEHPPKRIDPNTIARYRRGVVLPPVRWDGAKVVARLRLDDVEAIRAMKGGKIEVSPGYDAELRDESGTAPDGKRYDRVQVRRLNGNHVALTDRARGGPGVALRLDAADGVQIHEDEVFMLSEMMKALLAKLGIDAAGIADDAAAEAAILAKMGGAKPPTAAPTDPAKEKEIADLKAKIATMEGELASSKAKLAGLSGEEGMEALVEDAAMLGAEPTAEEVMDMCGKMDAAQAEARAKKIAKIHPVLTRHGAALARLDSAAGTAKPEGWEKMGVRARTKALALRVDSALPTDRSFDFYDAILTRPAAPAVATPATKVPGTAQRSDSAPAPAPKSPTRGWMDTLSAPPAKE